MDKFDVELVGFRNHEQHSRARIALDEALWSVSREN